MHKYIEKWLKENAQRHMKNTVTTPLPFIIKHSMRVFFKELSNHVGICLQHLH